MKKIVYNSKFEIESYNNHLKNIPSDSLIINKKSLLDSVNLLSEEVSYQSDKNKNLIKLIKFEKDDDKIKCLYKELESQLRENKNLKQK